MFRGIPIIPIPITATILIVHRATAAAVPVRAVMRELYSGVFLVAAVTALLPPAVPDIVRQRLRPHHLPAVLPAAPVLLLAAVHRSAGFKKQFNRR